MQLKLLHTADTHLGRPFAFLPSATAKAHRDRLRRTFGRIIDHANEDGFSLLIVAGDLFDSRRPDHDTLGFVIAQLNRLRIPAVLLPGNHDRPIPGSGYPYGEIACRCNHVRIFQGAEPEAFEFPDFDLVIYGQGVPDSQTPPLAGFRPRSGYSHHVIVFHGPYAISDRAYPNRPSIRDDDLASTFADYVALGDWHSCCQVWPCRPVAWYSGAPEPIKFGEVGAGFFLEVALGEGPEGVIVRQIEIGEARARYEELDISRAVGLEEVHAVLARLRDPRLILELKLKGLRPPSLIVSSEELESYYRPEFLGLRVIDESVPVPPSLPDLMPTTVIGAFVLRVSQRLEEARTEEERQLLREVLHLGVALLSGQEVKL